MRSERRNADARTAARSIWGGARPAADAAAGIGTTMALVRRKLPFLVLWIAAFVAGGALYVKLLRPDFVATTQVLLQPRFVINDGPEDERHFHQFMIDGEQCETELRVLRSEQLLYTVYKALNLDESPEIRSGPDGLWSYLGAKVHQFEGLIAPDDGVPGFYAFAERVRSRRLGLSYVIEISYRAQSPRQAVSVVNAIAVAYTAHRLRGVLARAQRSGVYLESRLTALHAQIRAADAGVRSGVVPDGSMPDADVRLLGSAAMPLSSTYPKAGPLLAFLAVLGTISGLLIVLLPPAEAGSGPRLAPVETLPERARIA